jgi:hypothetical protein
MHTGAGTSRDLRPADWPPQEVTRRHLFARGAVAVGGAMLSAGVLGTGLSC